MARRGRLWSLCFSLFCSIALPSLPISSSLLVRAAVPGMSCHGHGVLILHGHELSWVGLVWSGRAGPPFMYRRDTQPSTCNLGARSKALVSGDLCVESCSRLCTRPQGRALPVGIPDGTSCWDGEAGVMAIRRLQSSCQGESSRREGEEVEKGPLRIPSPAWRGGKMWWMW